VRFDPIKCPCLCEPSRGVAVRCGSIAAEIQCPCHVRFPPDRDQIADAACWTRVSISGASDKAFRLNKTQLNSAWGQTIWTKIANMNADYGTTIIESPYRWFRLTISLLLSTIASIGMWSAVVALPAVQADFGIDRASASLPFTFAFSGYAFGGALMGRLADRLGIVIPVTIGAVMLGLGYVGSSFSVAAWQYAVAYGIIGVGSSAAFAPLLADISHWFNRQRGIAVAIVSCGSYLAGTIWPPAIEYALVSAGWRQTHAGDCISSRASCRTNAKVRSWSGRLCGRNHVCIGPSGA
jgi:Major Facilitator Superfamily